MPELRDDVIDQAFHEGDTLIVNDLVGLIEKHHDDDQYGAPVDLVRAYVERLAEEDSRFEPEGVDRALDEQTVDDESWVDDDSLYDVGEGRVSKFPLAWHEALSGEKDVYEYLTFVVDTLPDQGRESFGTGGQGPGIPRQRLIDACEVIGGLSEDDVKRQLQRLGDEGEIVAEAEQHPHQRIYPADLDDGE